MGVRRRDSAAPAAAASRRLTCMIRRAACWRSRFAVAAPLHAQALPAPAVGSAGAASASSSTRLPPCPTGRVGIAAIDLASGREIAVHGDERFPMASVVKMAVAAAYLAEVDAGRRSLTKMIALDEAIRSGSDGIGQLMPHPGVTLSAANLIELMLTVSDNTATDMLIADLGGTARGAALADAQPRRRGAHRPRDRPAGARQSRAADAARQDRRADACGRPIR